MYYYLIIVSVISNFGMFVAELMEDTWQLCGMAECGLAPKFFAKKSKKYGAPIVRYPATLFVILIVEFGVVSLPCLSLLFIEFYPLLLC